MVEDEAPGGEDTHSGPLDVLEGALREAFSELMQLTDEEDAVLLYRCTRLAESSPLLLEACDKRRHAIESGLADKLSNLWDASRPKLLDAIGADAEYIRVCQSADHKDGVLGSRRQLEAARVAAAVREREFVLEKENSVSEALRLRAEADAKALDLARAEMKREVEAHRQRANREIAEASGRAQAEASGAVARAAEKEKEADRLRTALRESDEKVGSLTSENTRLSRELTEAQRQNEELEAALAREALAREDAARQAQEMTERAAELADELENIKASVTNSPEYISLAAEHRELQAQHKEALQVHIHACIYARARARACMHLHVCMHGPAHVHDQRKEP